MGDWFDPYEHQSNSVRRGKNKRKYKIKKQKSLDIIDEFDGKCVSCGTDNNLTIDHLIPRSRGGVNHRWNLAPMCRDCNAEKGAKIVGKWVRLAEKRRVELGFAYGCKMCDYTNERPGYCYICRCEAQKKED